MEGARTDAARREGRFAVVAAVLLLLAPALFFVATARPDLEGSDSAELVASSFALGIPHATGYPLYTWIGRLAIVLLPFDPDRDMNLLSALLGGAALFLFALALREATGRLLPAAVLLSGLGFGRPFWFVSTIAEVYTLHLLLVAATVFFLFRWGRTAAGRDLLLAVYFAALGISHHGSTVLLLPGYLLYVLLRAGGIGRAVRLAPLLLLAPLAFTVYLHHPIRHAARPPIDSFREIEEKVAMGLLDRETAGGSFGERFLYKTMGRGPGRKASFFGEEARRRAASFPAMVRRSIGTLALLAGIAGLALGIARGTAGGRAAGALLAWGLAANTLFFLNLKTEDLDDFLVPSFVFLAAGGALLAARTLCAPLPRGLRRAAAPLLLALFLALNGAEIVRASARGGGYRHSAPTLPRERQLLAEPFPDGAAILLPWGRATVLRYLQTAEGLRPDLVVHAVQRNQIDRVLPVLVESGPVFADDAGEETRKRYSVSSSGSLFRIEKREPSGLSR
ncbi:MAG: DUF2723 domain-containing protein [Candidatus Latescibacterota bacterium]|nr:MAG: DUF2723 domain-containing protein [Candidatus Latescibacterota bacterium]